VQPGACIRRQIGSQGTESSGEAHDGACADDSGSAGVSEFRPTSPDEYGRTKDIAKMRVAGSNSAIRSKIRWLVDGGWSSWDPRLELSICLVSSSRPLRNCAKRRAPSGSATRSSRSAQHGWGRSAVQDTPEPIHGSIRVDSKVMSCLMPFVSLWLPVLNSPTIRNDEGIRRTKMRWPRILLVEQTPVSSLADFESGQNNCCRSLSEGGVPDQSVPGIWSATQCHGPWHQRKERYR
jgi:hypothetical protein